MFIVSNECPIFKFGINEQRGIWKNLENEIFWNEFGIQMWNQCGILFEIHHDPHTLVKFKMHETLQCT